MNLWIWFILLWVDNLSHLPGKTIENIRKRDEIKIVDSPRRGEYQTAKSSFRRFQILDDGFVALEMRKVVNVFDRPVYVSIQHYF